MGLHRLWAMQAWLFLLGWLVWASALAQPEATARLQWDVGVGSESQSSPLFQLTPQSTIVYLEGADRLTGTHVRTALQGEAEWNWGAGVVGSLSGDATFKRSPGTPGFDFASLSIQPSVHVPLGAANVGVGINLQGIDVAGQHFRDVGGIQASWTLSDGKYLWGVVVDAAAYRHSGDLEDMNAIAGSVVLLHQINNPGPGIDGLDLSAIVGREFNERGLSELSNHSAMLSLLVRWKWLGVHWSAGRGWRHAVFDDTAFAGEPRREDRTNMLDLAVQWPLAVDKSIRFEFNEAHTVSSTRLFDNLYRQISVTLRTSF